MGAGQVFPNPPYAFWWALECILAMVLNPSVIL